MPDVNWLAAYAVGIAWAAVDDADAVEGIRGVARGRDELLLAASDCIARLPALDPAMAHRSVTLLREAAASSEALTVPV